MSPPKSRKDVTALQRKFEESGIDPSNAAFPFLSATTNAIVKRMTPTDWEAFRSMASGFDQTFKYGANTFLGQL